MPQPEGPDLTALQALVESSEFAAVMAAAEALEPMLMLERPIGPHLNAMLTGMRALASLEFAEPEPGDDEE